MGNGNLSGNKKNGMFIILATVFFAAISSSGLAYAQSGGYGTSSISLSHYAYNTTPGSHLDVQYTVSLESGNTWGTTLNVGNAQSLSASGINVSLSDTYGDPNYSGTATVSVSASAKPGAYNITFYATGDDPSSKNATLTLNVMAPASNSTPSNSTVIPVVVVSSTPHFKVIAENTTMVNATNGANLSVQSGAIRAVVRPGTYAMINGVIQSEYNFSLVVFSAANVSSPANTLNTTPNGEAYAFAVNGQITPDISLVNEPGDPYAVISYVVAGNNTTSWTWLGGTYNGTVYTGGSYAAKNVWTHPNDTVMMNDVFFKPVLWVFETEQLPAATTSVQPVTSSPQTTVPAAATGSSTLLDVAVVIILVIIAAVAYLLVKRR